MTRSVRRPVGRSVGLSDIITLKGRKFHFHANSNQLTKMDLAPYLYTIETMSTVTPRGIGTANTRMSFRLYCTSTDISKTPRQEIFLDALRLGNFSLTDLFSHSANNLNRSITSHSRLQYCPHLRESCDIYIDYLYIYNVYILYKLYVYVLS